MSGARFIAGDWGGTHLRLFLCDERGAVLAQRDAPGTALPGGAAPDVFDSLTRGWEDMHAVLCGMVGSDMGWTRTPYLPCPARPAEIIDACIALRGGRVHLMPGLSCRNPNGAPDFMRGEETQILGALRLEGALRHGSCLLCLPGTHTKWVWMQDGLVRQFLTAPTGEVFAVLRSHSVLVRGADSAAPLDVPAFEEAMHRWKRDLRTSLLHGLFECRSRQLSGELSAAAAAATLSAMLIASDVEGALQAFPDTIAASPIHVIGAPGLTRLYAIALQSHDHACRQVDGTSASLAGLTESHHRLVRETAHGV